MNKETNKQTEISTKVAVDYNVFTQVCKMGYLAYALPTGRVEFTFTRVDIQKMCAGEIVEKEHYGKIFLFMMIGVERTDVIEILKRSPLFQQLADQL